ncbi:MAG: cell surface protein SprA [Cryomorphaceae bacterium]|nr:cell surface protein SprA [Cryomorphaceae bacterium]
MNFGQRLLMAALAVLGVFPSFGQVRDSAQAGNGWSMPGLTTPTNIRTEVTYDPITGFYIQQKYIGNVPLGAPIYMSPAEYRQMVYGQQEAQGWQRRWAAGSAADQREGASMVPDMSISNPTIKDIFGSEELEIRPQGTAEIRFGLRYQHIKNPIVPERNRKTLAFDFDQKMQVNATGKLGDRLDMQINYDTEATFAFENKMKLDFKGTEDDIVKALEMGNVSLPTGGSLITGAQSLFGLKGQFQFGNTTVTTVMAEQRSQSQNLNIQGGATTQEFIIQGDNYEANRHFFLSQYFRDHYEQWLSTLPVIQSSVQISRVEVWVTNRRSTPTEVRNLIAFTDLGEGQSKAWRSTANNRSGDVIFPGATSDPLPSNRVNSIDPEELVVRFPGVRDAANAGNLLTSAGYNANVEYAELTNARKLQPNEFSFHPQLGYMTLNTALNQDEVLAVAYQYTANGRTYQVGEFSNDGIVAPKSLVLKLLKHTLLNVKSPLWDLMMKNVYSLNAFQLSPEDFRLEVLYRNDATGLPIPFLPKSTVKDKLLIQVLDLDHVNSNNDPFPDGLFDYVEGVTVLSQTGRVILPVLEPFGSALERALSNEDEKKRYVFQQLYDSTVFRAQEQTQLNKYVLRGRYKSAGGSLIQLNAFNIPRGSISVTAGGSKLIENQDFTVDYAVGQVRILNESLLQSGMPIRVSFENNTLFNMQAKTFAGTTVEHKISRDWTIGGSLLRLSERPLTQKVNAGDEPISNRIWGLNTQYQKNLPALTRFLDGLPFISTNAASRVQVQAEFAQLIPGSPRGIKINGEATTYLDDFETSQTTIDLRGTTTWTLASAPEGQSKLFPEAALANDWTYNANRARMSWYIIDPSFFASTSQTPENIRNNPTITSDHRQRMVPLAEVFPNIPLQPGMARNIAMFDLQFDPTERGPYNFDVEGFAGYSKGLEPDGRLKDPKSRWAGIMRQLTINNFEEQNIEFIQFWVIDPFMDDPTAEGGDLYFHLGNLSEDILKDGRQSFENGLSPSGMRIDVDSSVWGYTSKYQPVVDAFDNDPNARIFQDVGLDGLPDTDEGGWVGTTGQSYLSTLAAVYGAGSAVYQAAASDPAGDNFRYYRGPYQDSIEADILQRYRYFNNPDGNSQTTLINGLPATYTNLPDKEDVNRDATLNKAEQYFQYRISMRPEDLVIGKNHIADIYETTTDLLPDQTRKPVRWIQFKIPVFDPDDRVNGATDFRSIRFLRMVLKGWDAPTVMRFARLDLVRGEWRRYRFSLEESRELIPVDASDETSFIMNAVNLEENGGRQPIPYVLPPGIERQVLLGNTSLVQQNEQSLSMKACGLRDGDARAVFKNTTIDMRMNKRLRLFAHAEAGDAAQPLNDGDVRLFIRMGNDYSQNYYEYEVPLKVTAYGSTDPGVIWPIENEIDLAFDAWTSLKLERDAAVRDNPALQSNVPYEKIYGEGVIRVVGVPNLGNVRTMMMGIRNPKKRSSASADDGLDKCAEVWVNELRMTDFDNRGGMAALARSTAQLADLGQVALSTSYSTVGFGSLEMNPMERNKFSSATYDLQTNLELSKFLPFRTRLRLPFFINHAQDWKSPMFNPLNPDIEMSRALSNLASAAERDSLRSMVSDFTQRRGFNFTNVRFERGGGGGGGRVGGPAMGGGVGRGGESRSAPEMPGGKATGVRGGGGKGIGPTPFDLANWTASYAFNEVLKRDANTLVDNFQEYKGSLAYVFQTTPFNIQPFKKIKQKQFALIKDINLNLTPSRVSARAEVNRTVRMMQMRNVDNPKFELPLTFSKNFTMDRNYNVIWDLSKGLKFDYTARMRVRVDELQGPNTVDSVKNFMAQGIQAGGRPIAYHHTVNTSWNVPINKLPYMDFAQVQIRYTADYDWSTNSLLAVMQNIDSLNFGNNIENSGKWNASANLNFATFYNKFPAYKKLKQGTGRSRGGAPSRTPVSRGNNENKEAQAEASSNGFAKKILIGAVDVVTLVKSINLSGSLNTGILLPGFTPTPLYSGLNPAKAMAPGWQMLAGLPVDIGPLAAQNDWLIKNPNQPNRMMRTSTRTLNGRAQLEPLTDFRITLTANQTFGSQQSSTYRYSRGTGRDSLFPVGFHAFSPQNQQTFTTSWLAWNSAFEKSVAPDYDSDAYTRFLQNRLVLSDRLASLQFQNDPDYMKDFIAAPDSSRYGFDGYSVLQTDVLLNSFLSTYGMGDASTWVINDLAGIAPMPNWTVNYTGLMRIKQMRKIFTAFSINHAYANNLTVQGIQTNMLRAQRLQDNPTTPYPRNANYDILSENQVGQVSMSESFSPLIGVDIRTRTNASFKFEMGKQRQVALSMANNQITESKSTDVTIGLGYIIRDVQFTIVDEAGQRNNIKSNLELKLDLRLADNQTVIRRILEGFNQPTAGQKRTTIKFTADYRLSRRLAAQFYYDQTISEFKTSMAFPTNQWQSGIALRLNLGN